MQKKLTILSVMIGLLMLFGIHASAMTNSEIKNKIASFQSTMDGRFWNANKTESELISAVNSGNYSFGLTDARCALSVHDAAHHFTEYGCTSNTFNGGRQCAGFAQYMAYVVFGSKVSEANGWTYHKSASGITLEPGDIIRYGGHSAMVWYTSGDTLYVAEANWWDNQGRWCQVHFGSSWSTVSSVKNNLQYIWKHPTGGTTSTTERPKNVTITASDNVIAPGETVNFNFTVENANYWYLVVTNQDGTREAVNLITGQYSASYTFANEGVYTVEIQAANANGWVCIPVTVTVSNVPTNLRITANGYSHDMANGVTFDFTYDHATWVAVVIRKDGENKHIETVTGLSSYTHYFTEPGEYYIQLEAWRDGRCSTTFCEISVYNDRPNDVSITADKTYIQPGESVNFDFTLKNARYWYLVVTKGDTREAIELMTGNYKCSYTFANEGEYFVEVQTANSYGWANEGTTIIVSKNPQKPQLKNTEQVYRVGQEISFVWDATGSTTHYNLYFHKLIDGEYKVLEDNHYAESGLTRTFEPGLYRALLQSTNSNDWTDDGSSWRYTNAEWYYFRVDAYLAASVKEENYVHTVSAECYGIEDERKVFAVGYRDGRYVTADYTLEQGIFTLSGELDEIKVMVWDFDDMTPECDMVVIPDSEFTTV